MNTSEVLNKAADLIEERGWIKGPDGWTTDEASPLCLEGGIAAAMGHEVRQFGEMPTDEVYTCPAYLAVASYLDRNPQPPTSPIDDALWDWNDRRRSVDEVIEVLRAAAVIEAAKESADDREQVSA